MTGLHHIAVIFAPALSGRSRGLAGADDKGIAVFDEAEHGLAHEELRTIGIGHATDVTAGGLAGPRDVPSVRITIPGAGAGILALAILVFPAIRVLPAHPVGLLGKTDVAVGNQHTDIAGPALFVAATTVTFSAHRFALPGHVHAITIGIARADTGPLAIEVRLTVLVVPAEPQGWLRLADSRVIFSHVDTLLARLAFVVTEAAVDIQGQADPGFRTAVLVTSTDGLTDAVFPGRAITVVVALVAARFGQTGASHSFILAYTDVSLGAVVIIVTAIRRVSVKAPARFHHAFFAAAADHCHMAPVFGTGAVVVVPAATGIRFGLT